MKQCVDCRPPYRDDTDHGEDDRPIGERACNWLDWMATDDLCPHCGGPLIWFKPAPAGQILDAIGPLPTETG